MTQDKAALQYEEYIEEHIANVQKVWKAFSARLVQEDIVNKELILENLIWVEEAIRNHDKSKHSYFEFIAYRQNFFPCDGETKNDLMFHKAWCMHIASNPHHWEYWVTFKKGKPNPCPIPVIHLIDMLCDWTAMSIKFKNVPSEWYKENKENIIIHATSAARIKDWIPLFDEIYEMSQETL